MFGVAAFTAGVAAEQLQGLRAPVQAPVILPDAEGGGALGLLQQAGVVRQGVEQLALGAAVTVVEGEDQQAAEQYEEHALDGLQSVDQASVVDHGQQQGIAGNNPQAAEQDVGAGQAQRGGQIGTHPYLR
ncbi:hypothetical protein D3C71_1782430 [compost metagenome]